ncbi:FAD binding domain-containing protein [uncultured Roseobacter sp.]|uniref:FAD binding domain-containing protein n=1 Tax=uncultured Roseobacter sp. TaxID=114847 RepID=UPI002637E960|nr:FAD binding domain-containing protein [uncultured Roseobacter sp.]
MSYFAPDSLTDALSHLAGEPGQIVAGGTDVYPARGRRPAADRYLDVTRIAGFAEVSHGQEGTRFGAAVTWSDVVRADLPPVFDGLKAAAKEVGSIQIQNAGTLAGNICNASPAADGVPALMTLDAQVEIASAARGVRRVPLEAFLTGVRRTALEADELVTAIWIPAQPDGMRGAFEKLGARRYLVISICMTAAAVAVDAQGRIFDARIAVGACSAVAQRLRQLEQDVIGLSPDAVTVTETHLAPLFPIDDVRGAASYRLDAVGAQIVRAIRAAGTR